MPWSSRPAALRRTRSWSGATSSGDPAGCGCGRIRGARATVFSRRCGRALSRAPASTSSTAATCLLLRPSFPPERFVEVSQLYGRYAVAVNARGERYADEGADWSETALTRATAHQPGLYAWYVLDAEGFEGRVRERTAREMVETARSTGGTVIEAASLEELAEGSLNVACPAKPSSAPWKSTTPPSPREEDSHPRGAGQARPLRVPPFVAVKVAPSITHTVGGLAVDARLQGIARNGRSAASRASTPPGSRSAGFPPAGTRAASPRPSSSAEPPRSRRSRTDCEHDE